KLRRILLLSGLRERLGLTECQIGRGAGRDIKGGAIAVHSRGFAENLRRKRQDARRIGIAALAVGARLKLPNLRRSVLRFSCIDVDSTRRSTVRWIDCNAVHAAT